MISRIHRKCDAKSLRYWKPSNKMYNTSRVNQVCKQEPAPGYYNVAVVTKVPHCQSKQECQTKQWQITQGAPHEPGETLVFKWWYLPETLILNGGHHACWQLSHARKYPVWKSGLLLAHPYRILPWGQRLREETRSVTRKKVNKMTQN